MRLLGLVSFDDAAAGLCASLQYDTLLGLSQYRVEKHHDVGMNTWIPGLPSMMR